MRVGVMYDGFSPLPGIIDFVRRADDLGLVALDQLAEAPGLHVAGPVRDVDVKHLRRADAVVDLAAKAGQETVEQCGRERLAGG